MPSRSVPFRLWAGAAAAAVVVAAGAALLLRPAAPPQFTSSLAVSVPPATLPRLVQLSDRADVQVNFFFGVSLLMSARSIDVPEAIEPFTRVVTSGDPTYRQLASLYLGKAHI